MVGEQPLVKQLYGDDHIERQVHPLVNPRREAKTATTPGPGQRRCAGLYRPRRREPGCCRWAASRRGRLSSGPGPRRTSSRTRRVCPRRSGCPRCGAPLALGVGRAISGRTARPPVGSTPAGGVRLIAAGLKTSGAGLAVPAGSVWAGAWHGVRRRPAWRSARRWCPGAGRGPSRPARCAARGGRPGSRRCQRVRASAVWSRSWPWRSRPRRATSLSTPAFSRIRGLPVASAAARVSAGLATRRPSSRLS